MWGSKVSRRLCGGFGLGALAACSGGSFLAEREPWRKQAEAQCIGSGAVREGTGVVRINAINGPGRCGADYPLKVTSLGVAGAIGFGDELRPPGSIPGASSSMPRWPVAEPFWYPAGAACQSTSDAAPRRSTGGRCRRQCPKANKAHASGSRCRSNRRTAKQPARRSTSMTSADRTAHRQSPRRRHRPRTDAGARRAVRSGGARYVFGAV